VRLVKPGRKKELEISNSTRIEAYSRLWRAQPETRKPDCKHGAQRLLCRTVQRLDRKQQRSDVKTLDLTVEYAFQLEAYI